VCADLVNLGFDPVSVRKLRKKIGSLGHDNTAEERVAELKRFLRSQDLGHLSSRLITELGIFDADELPILMNDKKWVKSIGLSVADEIKLKSAVRSYAQSKSLSKTSSDFKISGKRKSITLRPLEPKSVSKDISNNVRRSLYKTVTETGLDRLDTRTSSCPEYLYNIKSQPILSKRKPALVVPTSVKWNADTVFTEGNPSVLSVARQPPATILQEPVRVKSGKGKKALRAAAAQEGKTTTSITPYELPSKGKAVGGGLPPGYAVDEALKKLKIISPRPRGAKLE
jgi:hypothetical protein